jgi:hypothetical protein
MCSDADPVSHQALALALAHVLGTTCFIILKNHSKRGQGQKYKE